MKTCIKCGATKPFEDFRVSSKSRMVAAEKSGDPLDMHKAVRGSCRACENAAAREYQRQRRARDPDAVNAEKRRRHAENPEVSRSQRRRYYAKNRDAILYRQRQERITNPELVRSRERRRREANPERARQVNRKWYARNIDKRREASRQWKRKNPEKHRQWSRDNRDRVRECKRVWLKMKMTDPSFRMERALRAMLHRTLRVASSEKTSRTCEMVGYNGHDLRSHIERQFTKGMSWENYGEWHIDHIIPISEHIASGETDPSVINCLTNLRPIWAKENLRKGGSRTHLL